MSYSKMNFEEKQAFIRCVFKVIKLDFTQKELIKAIRKKNKRINLAN